MDMNIKEETRVQFHEMGFDDRILMEISNMQWSQPTLIQEKAIQHFLNGKDVLARARTGSGKTAAFLLPIIQKILDDKQTASEQAVRAVIIEPTKELCKQTSDVLNRLTSSCKREIRSIDVSPQVSLDAQKPLLIDHPDIVIGTPSRILAHLEEENLNFRNLKYVALDEADLMFVYDYKDQLKQILRKLPIAYQTFITSATLGEDITEMKELFLHNPVLLKLEESPLPSAAQLTQYVIELENLQKAVFILAVFQLNLIRGKTIIFVNTAEQIYKLKMYLAQFQLRSCCICPEMPRMSRCNIVDEFNQGTYNILITSDDKNVYNVKNEKTKHEKEFEVDTESGISRGIDFKYISNIINFDFPLTIKDYIHRVGRTARGTNEGTALSLVTRREKKRLDLVEASLAKMMGDKNIFKEFKFDMNQIEGFQYRAKDAWLRCNKFNIKQLRQKEIRLELENCGELQEYFGARPRDLEVLRRNLNKASMKTHIHMRNVPDYNIPSKLKRVEHKKIRKGNAKKFKKRLDKEEQTKKSRSMLETAKVLGLRRHGQEEEED